MSAPVSVCKVFECEEFSVYQHLPISKSDDCLVVVCFDEIVGGLNKRGFGVEFLNKNGVECFFVSHKEKSYFQGLSGEELKEILYPYVKERRVFTFGASLGGYAAIYYAPYLDAQPLAFSPLCSRDPIFLSSNKNDFHHNILSDESREGCKKPIVVIDPKDSKDVFFYENRVQPSYGDSIVKVELPYATHWTAAALKSQGILKKFVLAVINGGDFYEVSRLYSPSRNAFSLTHMALAFSKEGDYEMANDCLGRLLSLESSPPDDLRLRVYDILVSNNALSHFFSRSLIKNSEKKAVLKRGAKEAKGCGDEKSYMLSLIKMHWLLMQYDVAMEISLIFEDIYKKPEEGVVDESNKRLQNSQGWVV